MVLLSDIATTTSEDELAQWQALFFTSFKQHIFPNTVDVVDSASGLLPPYLRLALACLSSVTSPSANMIDCAVVNGNSGGEISAGLFYAGVNLWSVMLEVDNREARLFEAVLAVRFHHLHY